MPFSVAGTSTVGSSTGIVADLPFATEGGLGLIVSDLFRAIAPVVPTMLRAIADNATDLNICFKFNLTMLSFDCRNIRHNDTSVMRVKWFNEVENKFRGG